MKQIKYFLIALIFVVGSLFFWGYTRGSTICNIGGWRPASEVKKSDIYNAPLLNIPFRMGLKRSVESNCSEQNLAGLKDIVFRDW